MNKIVATLFVTLCVTMLLTGYTNDVQSDLQENLIRLHIVANSDDCGDQEVKLKVRDDVLNEVRNDFLSLSKEDIVKNLKTIEDTANNTLRQNGFDYTATAEYGMFSFPKKTYKSITLPSGNYYGVRIVLGTGSGHNWWCVMYPPLCVKEDGTAELSEQGEKMLKENLGDDTYEIITQSDKKAVLKFKLVEIVRELIQKIENPM